MAEFMRWFTPPAYTGRFSHRTRRENLKRMQETVFDLVVIGGGITGAGIARDAVQRGMRVALLEKGDYGGGTSSRSSKLIHGGLRYLKQLDIGLVRESLAERQHLMKVAPYLVFPIEFVFPIYAGWTDRFEKWIGMLGYDLLKRGDNLARHRNLSPEEVLELEPQLRVDRLSGGFVYYDCVVNDARLTLLTLKTAAEQGARVANYAKMIGLEKADAGFQEVRFEDRLGGDTGSLRARVVTVAGGPWTDDLLQVHKQQAPLLRPTKGVHLVFPAERLRIRHAVVISNYDKRFLFAVPHGEFAYVGTTDTDYTGSLEEIPVEAGDVDYLIDALNRFFPHANLTPTDVVSAWAALRPLLREEGLPSKISRDYHMDMSEDGFTLIAGGKLTTYRLMAENLLDRVIEHYSDRFGGQFQPCHTADSALTGGETTDFSSYLRTQMDAMTGYWRLETQTAERLIKNYGSHHMAILALGSRDRQLLDPIHREVPMLRAEVVYAVEEEMALTLADFMCRRVDLMHFDRKHGLAVVERVAAIMGRLLGWSRRHRRTEIGRYRQAVERMLQFQKH
jgi:glycerol-3-phosphate dehydrogenase